VEGEQAAPSGWGDSIGVGDINSSPLTGRVTLCRDVKPDDGWVPGLRDREIERSED